MMDTDLYQKLHPQAFFALIDAEVTVWDAVQAALGDAGLDVGVGRLIPLLYLADGPMTLRELTERTRAKASASSRLMERMVKDGLVVKEHDAKDRRAVVLRITDEGREVARAGSAVLQDALATAFGKLGAGELEMLQTLLARLGTSETEQGR